MLIPRLLAASSGPGGGSQVQLTPDPTALPGASMIQSFANGLASWGLIAAMIGIIVGAVIWAFGHYSQNYQQSVNGRKGVMVSGLAALLIGAAPYIINTLFGKGVNLKGVGL
jgi:MFS family permease